jgi:hypothetical protein
LRNHVAAFAGERSLVEEIQRFMLGLGLDMARQSISLAGLRHLRTQLRYKQSQLNVLLRPVGVEQAVSQSGTEDHESRRRSAIGTTTPKKGAAAAASSSSSTSLVAGTVPTTIPPNEARALLAQLLGILVGLTHEQHHSPSAVRELACQCIGEIGAVDPFGIVSTVPQFTLPHTTLGGDGLLAFADTSTLASSLGVTRRWPALIARRAATSGSVGEASSSSSSSSSSSEPFIEVNALTVPYQSRAHHGVILRQLNLLLRDLDSLVIKCATDTAIALFTK